MPDDGGTKIIRYVGEHLLSTWRKSLKYLNFPEIKNYA